MRADPWPIGVQEDGGGLRATLTARGLTVVELHSAASWEAFRGRLAFCVADRDGAPDESAFLTAVKVGLAVVWLQTTPATSPPAAPVAERERCGRGSLVVAPAALLTHLDHSVTAQLTLLRLQWEGGRPLSADEMRHGQHLSTGSVLGGEA